MKIRDARAAITGGASGLGLAVARHLVAAGGKVVLLDVQEGPGRVAVDELGRDATFQRCDVTSEAEVNVAMEAAHAWLGGMNLLVNCAGVIGAGRVLGKSGPMPGAIATQRIPKRASSRAIGNVMPATPALVAEYAACPICPSKAAIEEV